MRRAYSLIDWLIVFAAVMAVAAMVNSTLKRTIDSKARGLSDIVIWKGWGSDVPVNGAYKAQVYAPGSLYTSSKWVSWNSATSPMAIDDPSNYKLMETEKNTQMKTGSTQTQKQYVLENKDGSVNYGTTSVPSIQTHASRSVSIGASEDQAYLIKKNSVNDLGVDVDASHD